MIEWVLYNTGKCMKVCNVIAYSESGRMCGFNAYKYVVLEVVVVVVVVIVVVVLFH